MKSRIVQGAIALVLVGLLVATLGYVWAHRVADSRLVSCANHKRFVAQELWYNYPGSNLEDYVFDEIPHDPKLPGYGVIAKYAWGDSFNCHHGGGMGWQAVNLPEEKWMQLWEAHLKLYELKPEDGGWIPDLPFFWCGGPNLLGDERVGRSARYIGNGQWSIDGGGINAESLTHLNDCLVAIGEPPMDWDVPKGIDWTIYSNDDSYKRIPDHIGADGEVVYRITPRRGEAARMGPERRK